MVLLMAPLAGCGGPETVGEPPRVVEGGEEEPDSLIGRGGSAQVALPGVPAPACQNPYLPECRGAEALLGVSLEAPLVLGPDLDYYPLLAEELPSFEAGTLRLDPFTVEYRLREGIAFSDGEPLTSADAKWTYEEAARLARDLGPAAPYPGFGRVSRVETPDERTIRLRFDEPYAPWRELLSAPILPRHRYESEDFARMTLDRGATGSGPFVLLGSARDVLAFSANPSYWVIEEPAPPSLEGLEVRFGSGGAGALAAGEADLGLLTPRTGETLPGGDLLSALAAPARVERLLFNARRGALVERGEREAVAGALDRDRLAALAGSPAVAQSFVPPDLVPGYTPAWGEDYSRGAVENGRAPGGALVLVYPETPGGDPERAGLARALVSQLRSAGIEAEARPVGQAEFYGETLPRGDFDLALYAPGWPEGLETLLPNVPPESRAALESTLAAADDAGRAEALAAAQETLARETALVPLFVWPDAYAWSSTLSGPRPLTPQSALLWNVREWGFYE